MKVTFSANSIDELINPTSARIKRYKRPLHEVFFYCPFFSVSLSFFWSKILWGSYT